MSVHTIYLKDGVKMMRPIHNREEFLGLRNGGEQKQLIARIRAGDEGLKSKLVQMNYSCLPNADGSLKGSKTASMSVGMDIDHLTAEEMPAVRERILSKKAYLRPKLRVARPSDSLLRRLSAGREACEDQERACFGVQRFPAAPPQYPQCVGDGRWKR